MSTWRRTSRGGNHVLQWRGQSVEEEWANERDMDDLLRFSKIGIAVHSRTDGECYLPDCNEPLCSTYPHVVPVWDGGVDHAINRAGVCLTHLKAMRGGRDPVGEIRRTLRLVLMRYYAANGVSPAQWYAMASGQLPILIAGGESHGSACLDRPG